MGIFQIFALSPTSLPFSASTQPSYHHIFSNSRYSSLFTVHYFPFTVPHSLFSIHHSLFTIHFSPTFDLRLLPYALCFPTSYLHNFRSPTSDLSSLFTHHYLLFTVHYLLFPVSNSLLYVDRQIIVLWVNPS